MFERLPIPYSGIGFSINGWIFFCKKTTKEKDEIQRKYYGKHLSVEHFNFWKGGTVLLKPFEYYRPCTLEEAAEYLKQDESRIMAGGTDLLVSIRKGAIRPEAIVDIKGIEELRGISLNSEGLSIGAAVTINEIINSEEIQDQFPILVEAGRVLASHQVRNRATVAGNLCNASPAADMALPLLALDASAEVFSSKGRREIPLRDLFAGVKKTILSREDILVSLKVLHRPGKGRYMKKARIKGPDLSAVGVACFKQEKTLRVAIGACAPTPKSIEMDISGMTADEIAAETKKRAMNIIDPIDDVRASADYRRALVEVFIERILDEIL
jgi:carbon-monoxide dehydrogenase medium subunit